MQEIAFVVLRTVLHTLLLQYAHCGRPLLAILTPAQLQLTLQLSSESDSIHTLAHSCYLYLTEDNAGIWYA
jgi:hypothetical protein